jgi:outer membrane protein OmpA-like peptidoglycan-associated protein
MSTTRTTKTLAAILLLGAISIPALAQDHGAYGGDQDHQGGPDRGGPEGGPDYWDRGGGGPDDRRHYDLAGPGVPLLYADLRNSQRGRAFVMRNFDMNRDGFIDPREARAADRAFDQMAHGDRRHFAWGRGGDDRSMAPPFSPGPPAAESGWDRQGMRAYHFRQNRYGAMFSMGDVLFQTGSAALRPGAADKLRTLAGYLHAHPAQGVRIDGFTDAVGSAASNIALSRARADSVAHALSEQGVNPQRLSLTGHGEADPVASNTDAAGRQLNRRVEVTLVGQRADSFN